MIINSESKIVVGVTQRIDKVEGRAEHRDALDQKLIKLLSQTGFLPVAIPNSLLGNHGLDDWSGESVLSDWLQTIRPDALLLSGGNNIGEFPERDDTESCLLSWAEMNRIPVLGICRGMQMMGVWAGTKLKKVEGHVRTRHMLRNGLDGEVNSYHDFSLVSCPQEFEILATDETGEIEAIRHMSLPWEGWMWHPEREEYFQQCDIQRLKGLFVV